MKKIIFVLFLYHHLDILCVSSQRTQNQRQYKFGYSIRAVSGNSSENLSCSKNPCGFDAFCFESKIGKPVCSCPPGYKGDPLLNCYKGECEESDDCRDNQACENSNCVNPCIGQCGLYAKCTVINHAPVCSCPEQYKGDPTVLCIFEQIDLCDPSPCGINTKCEVIDEQPTCSCLATYEGNPLNGCRRECESDNECENHSFCKDFKCVRSCTQCGKNATCTGIRNHQAICDCPRGYLGSPYLECRPECYSDVDCKTEKSQCVSGFCKNPCDGACGINAECKNFKNIFVICACPAGFTGDAFEKCRELTPEDLCRPNPCGKNAICSPGYDRSQRETALCSCPPGYTGNPVNFCHRGECLSDSECPDNSACIGYKCQNVCVDKCGDGAICEGRNHLAVCSCPEGLFGDALVSCRLPRSFAVARFYHNNRK